MMDAEELVTRNGERVLARLAWYLGADKNYLLTGFSRRRRCAHRTKLLGLRCWREWTSDHFCGLHNSLCWGDEDTRCERPAPLSFKWPTGRAGAGRSGTGR